MSDVNIKNDNKYRIVLHTKEIVDYESNLSRDDTYTVFKTNYVTYFWIILRHIEGIGLRKHLSKFDKPQKFDSMYISCSDFLANKIRELEYVKSVYKIQKINSKDV